MPKMNEYLRFLCWILTLTQGIICYNVDTKFPILYSKNPSDNFFGFSVGLIRNTYGYRALITAPRTNSSFVNAHQPGALFSCSISTSGGVPQCEEVEVNLKGNEFGSILDDMWLGVSLDTQDVSKDNNVVVCGHLWKNEVYNSQYLIRGTCYVLNSDLNTATVDKIVPFKDTRKYFDPTMTQHAQSGASAAFSEDGLSLLLGSPGYNHWKGTFVTYELDPSMKIQHLRNPLFPKTQLQLSASAYMGYSITSGKFFSDRNIYTAVGAPRDNDYKGKVYVFFPFNERRGGSLFGHIQGNQVGEYFGASVSGIDLNGDGRTDLLVGAPFYSEESGGDEGKVYIYVGSTHKTFAQEYYVNGQNEPNARFGTCIGNTGDLNKDGFNDVAIGAPYEDGKGAVYIYYGTTQGIGQRHVQRIRAEEINRQITGFGISISRGLDIDDNHYPDILIGSYASSNAVLLRAYPVIRLSSTLYFDTPMIDMDVTACDISGLGGKFPCFNVTYCLTYSGNTVPPSLAFQTELRTDTGGRRSPTARGFFLPGGQTQPQTSITQKIQILAQPAQNCFTERAYIYNDISDEMNSVQFSLSYDLDRNETVSCQTAVFPKDCPVIDSASLTTITKSIRFKTDCKDICQADLSVEAYIAGNPEKTTLIVGQNNSLTLDIRVRNQGEPAYVTELFISIPPETPLIKYDQCEMGRTQQEEYFNTTLKCSFRNPLKNGETASIQIVVDTTNIPAGKSSLMVYVKASTESVDTDQSNNELTLAIYFETAADVNITGNPENPRIPQTEEQETVTITHNYYVKYYGPSPVDKIDINIYVPSAIKGENGTVTFLTLNDFVSDSGEISTKCNSSFTNMAFKTYDGNEPFRESSETLEVNRSVTNSHHITKRSSEESTAGSVAKNGKDYILDCASATCDVIHCDASPFRSGQKSIKFILTVQVDLDVLSSVMKAWNSIKFITKGEISMDGIKMLSDLYRTETTVETAIVRLRPPGTKKVENWIIFVSIGVGLLLLVIILAVLIKIGFFKRKQRERMESMRKQVQAKEMKDMSAEAVAEDKELCPNDKS